MLVRELQERAALAFPPLRVEHRDGWWLRHADGSAWWAGSVLPHSADLGDRIADAEAFYAALNTPARFQVSPGACPPGLDAALAARGYRIESPMSLGTAPTATVTGRLRADDATVSEKPTDAWFAVWRSVHGGPEPDRDRDMLARVTRPTAYASVVADGEVVAVGRVVADAGWAGIFAMATLPHARGRGAGRRVLAALAHWAAARRAHHLYLQVDPDNAAADRLYARAGFAELCRYHYRVRVAAVSG
ncbi:GNAT family N-acetyltransferase [Luedemannella flava]|uniref:GNAT family N-acetyltransferase n=1 Tax=Luedemannella flava TaxID=349316 RepID=A0ABN2LLQ5_9ACTN